MTDGLYVYLGSGDIADRQLARTIAKLRRCGAVGALPVIESVDGRRQSVASVRRVCDELRAADITPVPFSFPSLAGNLLRSRAHMLDVWEATGAAVQIDVEPLGRDRRWSQRELDVVMQMPAKALHSITSTRAQMPALDAHGVPVWLQLESEVSWRWLDASLARWPDAVIVSGLFDEPEGERTLDDLKDDLSRYTPQAVKTGAHAVWSCASMSDAEADVLRGWAVETWKARAA